MYTVIQKLKPGTFSFFKELTKSRLVQYQYIHVIPIQVTYIQLYFIYNIWSFTRSAKNKKPVKIAATECANALYNWKHAYEYEILHSDLLSALQARIFVVDNVKLSANNQNAESIF